MRQRSSHDGPDEPLRVIVDGYNRFPRHHAVTEGHDSGTGFELCIHYEAGRQPRV